MKGKVIHCPDLRQHSTLETPIHVLVLDLWDGPSRGVIRCSTCCAEYLFDLIGWQEREEEADLRIFCLSPMPQGAMDDIVGLCPKTEPIRWPIATPVWHFSAPEQEAQARELMNDILSRAEEPTMIVASLSNASVQISQVKLISGKDTDLAKQSLVFPRQRAGVRDWVAFMGKE